MTMDKVPNYTESRRQYLRAYYYKNKEQLLEGYAYQHAVAITQLLDLNLTTNQLTDLKDYIKDNFKARKGVKYD